MKEILQKGLLFLVFAAIAIVAGFIFLAIAVGMIATLLGNLAIWPVIAAALFGVKISFGGALGIAALMALIIYGVACYAPVAGDRFFEGLGALMSIGTMSFITFGILGLPGWLLANYMNGEKVSPWLILPIGVATLAALLTWGNMTKKPD